MASRIAPSVATADRTSTPRLARRSSPGVGSAGSAQAMRRTPWSTESGQKRYWRRYWGESRWTNGGLAGNSSRSTYGSSKRRASARAISSGLESPRRTMASGRRSPVVRRRSSARARSASVRRPVAASHWPKGASRFGSMSFERSTPGGAPGLTVRGSWVRGFWLPDP